MDSSKLILTVMKFNEKTKQQDLEGLAEPMTKTKLLSWLGILHAPAKRFMAQTYGLPKYVADASHNGE